MSTVDSNKVESLSLDRSNDQDEISTYQYIFKIILIGDSNTGKTSLINRYVTKSFASQYICTIGVDFMMKTIVHDNLTIKLQLWDTAGMEKYKQITTSYYRGAQAAIVCFDLTSKVSFLSVSKWVDDFCQYYNPIFQRTLVIVGNKSDLIEEREVSKEEIEALVQANGLMYIETSAKTGDNVEALFLELAKRLYEKYKNNVNTQIRNAIQIRRTQVKGDKFHDLLEREEKKRKGCC